MAYEFKLPDIGEGLTEADIVRWVVPVGAEVAVDQVLVEVETAKVVVEMPSPVAGVVLHHGAAEGETLDVGSILAVIGEPGEAWGSDEPTGSDDSTVLGGVDDAPLVGTRGMEQGALRITPAGIVSARASRRTLQYTGDAVVNDPGGEYDVALSFAGEQRPYVEQVAAALAANGVRVFYDDYETVELWGKDLYEHLDDVYRRRSRFVMIFVSADYASKAWPTHERKSAQARALEESGEYILPVRFDDTELPGLRPTVGYLDARKNSADEIATSLLTKLGRVEESGPDEPATGAGTSSWHVDLALLWHENGSSRYSTRWEPGLGFSDLRANDDALDGMGTSRMPIGLPLEECVSVVHLRGRHLKFLFSDRARPITARLHHGDDVYEPTGKGGGADLFLEFNLARWPHLD